MDFSQIITEYQNILKELKDHVNLYFRIYAFLIIFPCFCSTLYWMAYGLKLVFRFVKFAFVLTKQAFSLIKLAFRLINILFKSFKSISQFFFVIYQTINKKRPTLFRFIFWLCLKVRLYLIIF